MFQKKILTSLFLILTFIGGFFANITINTGVSVGVNWLYAAGVTTNPDGKKVDETDCKGVNCAAKALNSIFQVVTIVAMPAIVLASWLMSPDWTSGDAFNLRDTMYKLWVTVSNVIYFIYAVLLIIIAIGTILWNEKFGYKAMLPRLALGIIMVPFTWWFVQWTISLATVVTASVISIPADLWIAKENNSFMDSYYIPNKWTLTSDTSNSDAVAKQNIEKCSKRTQTWDGCTNLKEFYEKSGGIYGSLLIYAYGVFEIQKIQKADGSINTITSIGQLVNELILWVLFFVIFWILVLALVFMLMMRAIKLWMYAIFSPLFTIHFVLGKDTLWEKMWDFNLKEFIGLCFVPAVVWITLSFWLVVIGAIKSVGLSQENSDCGNTSCTIKIMWTESSLKTEVQENWGTGKTVTTLKIGTIEMVFEGKAYPTSASDSDNTNTTGNIKKWLNILGPLLGTIIIDIIALIFIWVAFMAAKSTSKAVAKAIDPFEKLGKSIWDIWASLPKYAPLPIPGGSLAGATKGVSQLWNISEQLADKRYKESNLGKFVQGLDPSSKMTDEQMAKLNQIRWNVSTQKWIKELLELKQELSGSQNLYNWDIKKVTESALKDTSKFMNAIDTSNYALDIKRKLKTIASDTNLTNEEKDILITALIKWYSVSKIEGDLKKSVAWAKSFVSNSTGNSSWTTSSWTSAWIASRAQGAEYVNITIGGKNISADIKVNDKDIPGWEINKIVEGFKDKKSWMKKEDFINGLTQHMRPEVAEKIANALNKDGFFTE